MHARETAYDLAIIGGGINGAGIARDAAGRGLRVILIEQDDLAAHTSSASTKLIHGGLRYLEYREFRLVREALREREVLLRIARNIARPLSFVLPLGVGTRPGWMIRLGLLLYDRLGGKQSLPRSRAIRLDRGIEGEPLKPGFRRGFVYSDGWMDDARLVILNALDAHERGAEIRTRTRFIAATREKTHWTLTLDAGGKERCISATALVNATGPWVNDLLAMLGQPPARPARLIKGSHIVIPRLYAGNHAYILQNPDQRIVFAIPYEGDLTLVGTTELNWQGDPSSPAITAEETDYLCRTINSWFARPIAPRDVVHSYSGIRSLYDDGQDDPRKVTRDYVLDLDAKGGAALLSIFGGKITTYRQLAENALAKLAPHLPSMGASWTAATPLPGADFDDPARLLATIRERWPWLETPIAQRMARAYGTRIAAVLGDAQTYADLGRDFGGGLTEGELRYLRDQEWAMTADDIIWRRSKLGLHLDAAAIAAIREAMGG